MNQTATPQLSIWGKLWELIVGSLTWGIVRIGVPALLVVAVIALLLGGIRGLMFVWSLAFDKKLVDV